MSDAALNFFLASGTNAERLAFTPSPATPAAGPDPTYIWFETDTGDSFAWDFGGSAWGQLNTAGAVANAVTFDNSGAGDASGTTYNGSAARTISSNTLGLGTADSPQFIAINLGHASDTTLTRVSAGVVAIEGNAIYHAGGTDVPVADGGTGASTAAGAATNLGLGTGDSPQFTAVNIGHASDTTLSRVSAGDLQIEANIIYRAGGTDVAVADGGTGSSTAAGAATNLGLGTGDSPQFTAVNIGHATDTTITRTGAGDIAVEGNAIYRAGGTDVPVTDGGTGVSTLTNHGVVLGQGTSAVAVTAAGSAGQLLTSGGASADPSWANPPVITPQGRLTLTSATPVMNADATAQGTIYYAEMTGNCVPIYDGTTTRILTFNNLSLILDSSNFLTPFLYDVFVWNSSGTATLGGGPAWNYNATATMTIATPCVVTWTAHGLNEGDPIVFTTSGALPTGLTAGTVYYVGRSPAANTFNVSTTVANAAAGTFIATSGTQSGTHTGTNRTRARGTGAGTTELQLKNGIWTNKNSITLYNNSVSSGSISANQATYLGTFYCTANGQTGMAFEPSGASGGSANILGLFNAYNRREVHATSKDTATSYTYNTNTWRSANGNVNNRITFVDGLAECRVRALAAHAVQQSSAANESMIGINFDNTNATPSNVAASSTTASALALCLPKTAAPALGLRYAQAVEFSSAATGTFYPSVNSQQRQQLSVTLEM